jgi:hypothetical protein
VLCSASSSNLLLGKALEQVTDALTAVPRYERARVLANAIEIATRQIQEPIGRIVVSGGSVTLWGRRRRCR